MNILGWGNAIEKGLELIDDTFTSDEEREEDRRKLIEVKTDAKVRFLEATSHFKIAQRLLAILFCVPYVALTVIGMGGIIFGWVDIADVREAASFANELNLGWIVLTIVVFYFGGGVIDSAKRKVPS